MDVKELRIGNLIIADNEVVKVSKLGLDSIGWGLNNFAPPSSSLADFKPIPLTEEFVREHIQPVSVSGWFHVFDSNISLRLKSRTLSLGSISIPMPEHVHTFQNLIFALTGKELEIKL